MTEAKRDIRRKLWLLKRGENARDRILSPEEYLRFLDGAGVNLKAILIIAMNTGMRRGEIIGLRWSHIDNESGLIRLPKEVTKEKKPKIIPINHHVRKVLDSLPRALHHDFVITWRGEAHHQESSIITALSLQESRDPLRYV